MKTQSQFSFKKFLFPTLLLLLLAHYAVYLISGIVIPTSTIALYLSLIPPVVFLLRRLEFLIVRKKSSNSQGVKVFAVTFIVLLMLLDIGVMFTPLNYSYHERRNFYYKSLYINYRKPWYHVWKHDHKLKTSEYEYERVINSLGLSGEEPDINKRTGSFRVICLGDSFTEGDGAPADSSWPAALQNIVDKHPEQRNFDVINAGVCGSDPWFSFVLLRDKLMPYKPDMVIQAVNFSDVYDMIIRGGAGRFKPNGTVKYSDPPCWEFFYASSRFIRWIAHHTGGYDEFLIKPDELLISKIRALRQLRLAFTLTGSMLDQDGVRYAIVFHPLKHEVDKEWFPLYILAEHMRKHTDWEIVDLYEFFRKSYGMNVSNTAAYYWMRDGHHKSRGYDLMAEGIYRSLFSGSPSETADSTAGQENFPKAASDFRK